MQGTRKSFRILALDGGGIKGAFTASVIAEWEKATELRVHEHFDLITGTSTGGILAIGLGLGLSGEQILEFYKKKGPIIFPATGFGRKQLRMLWQLLKPGFSNEVLQRELAEVLQDRKFGDSKVRLVIPAYDILRGRIYLFKTRHHPRFNFDRNIPATDVALATTAAPTYFPAAAIPLFHGQPYVDGGIWANCPALVGVVEAVSFLGIRLEEIELLSVGTTYAPGSERKLASSGLIGWSTRIVNLLLNAQVEAAQAQAKLLVGEERFLRVDDLTQPEEFTLANAEEIDALAQRGRAKAIEKAVLEPVQTRFLNGLKAEPFVAITRNEIHSLEDPPPSGK